jgi:hypothetical protein
MKKKIILGFSVAVVAFALGLGYMTYTKTTTNALLLANLEALTNPENGGGNTGGGNGESEEFNCVLQKDNCTFTINTYAQLEIIRKIPGLGGLSIGATIDLSDGTQIYAQASWYHTNKVRCGQDITCHSLLMGLL